MHQSLTDASVEHIVSVSDNNALTEESVVNIREVLSVVANAKAHVDDGGDGAADSACPERNGNRRGNLNAALAAAATVGEEERRDQDAAAAVASPTDNGAFSENKWSDGKGEGSQRDSGARGSSGARGGVRGGGGGVGDNVSDGGSGSERVREGADDSNRDTLVLRTMARRPLKEMMRYGVLRSIAVVFNGLS